MKFDKKFGWYDSTEEFIAVFPDRINFEPEGFYACANDGIRLFRLSGTQLVGFADRCVGEYLRRGAVPCRPGAPDYDEDWVELPGYGATADEIRHNVIAEWVAAGAGEIPPWTGVWFGLPKHVTPLAKATPVSGKR